MSEPFCPICAKNYSDVHLALWVCEKHLDTWIITICDKCKQIVFSPEAGKCLECYWVTIPEEDQIDVLSEAEQQP